MGKISGKQFQAILERQLENNIEKLRLVMNVNIRVQAIILSTCHSTYTYKTFYSNIGGVRENYSSNTKNKCTCK